MKLSAWSPCLFPVDGWVAELVRILRQSIENPAEIVGRDVLVDLVLLREMEPQDRLERVIAACYRALDLIDQIITLIRPVTRATNLLCLMHELDRSTGG